MFSADLACGCIEIFPHDNSFEFQDLCGLASRENPNRGYLFVSKVLGKHFPVRPSDMRAVYDNISAKITDLVSDEPTLFLGMAETAVGLGHGVYESFIKSNAHRSVTTYVHSTRYSLDKSHLNYCVNESHSHAKCHYIHKTKYDDLYTTLVLIDDELSTGSTFVNLIEQVLKTKNSIKRIVIGSIISWLSDEKKKKIKKLFPLKSIEFVSLFSGEFRFTANESFRPVLPCGSETIAECPVVVACSLGRHGIEGPIGSEVVRKTVDQIIENSNLVKTKTVSIVGTGEFLYLPYLVALEIESKGFDVRFQSTTRSPILVDGIIETKILLNDVYEQNVPHYVYNLDVSCSQVVFLYETKQKHQVFGNSISHYNLEYGKNDCIVYRLG